MRQRREALGLSQSALARSIGVTPQAIQGLESGRTESFRKLVQLASALGVAVDWLQAGGGAPALSDQSDGGEALMARIDFGRRVSEARKVRGLEVAAAARGILPAAVWRALEQGEHWPDPLQLDLICGRLGQSLDWLVRGIVIADSEIPAVFRERRALHQPASNFDHASAENGTADDTGD